MNKSKSVMCGKLTVKARWLWEQTIRLHGRAPETRLASSLSLVEILTALYYNGYVKSKPAELNWEGRDRVIISKGHGAITLYAILADLGYYPMNELERVGQQGSFLGGIPDPIIPGFETVNGSLGHGLGVGCGMACGLRQKDNTSTSVVVIVGDGELHEGANWEAAMFAGHHRLNNVVCIVDFNKKAMLDNTDKIIGLEPLDAKFSAFGWDTFRVDGHNLAALTDCFERVFKYPRKGPVAIIADTIKGRGVPVMESDPLCHVRTLSKKEIAELLGETRD
ncbi:MAG TPA: transketolase [Kiritimatiellia bacterium]|nr:transketolase [Kiritimatiellia bacterium]HNS79849.1 transketolase [Kiritimatiellia bacterium]HQQ04106.1 transketolase [Kiritimatiellia bacterium]